MSMNGVLRSLPPKELERLLVDKAAFTRWTTGRTPTFGAGMHAMVVASLRSRPLIRWLPHRLQDWVLRRWFKVDPEASWDVDDPGPEEIQGPSRAGHGARSGGGRRLDLFKSWHVVHYAIAGTGEVSEVSPLMGPQSMPPGFDLGFGPPFVHDSRRVKKLARALEQGLKPEWRERLRGSAPRDEGLYAADDREDAVHAMAMIEEIRRFYTAAAAADEAVLFWVE